MNKHPSRHGFTLIELLIVIAIIGILAAVLIPNLLGSRNQAFDTGAMNCSKALQEAQTAYYGKRFTYATGADKLNRDLLAPCYEGQAGQGIEIGSDPDATDGAMSHANAQGFLAYVRDARGSTTYSVTQSTIRATNPTNDEPDDDDWGERGPPPGPGYVWNDYFGVWVLEGREPITPVPDP